MMPHWERAPVSGTNDQCLHAPYTVGLVNASGVINTTTALTDVSSGNNVRAATSTDGTNLWVAGRRGRRGLCHHGEYDLDGTCSGG